MRFKSFNSIINLKGLWCSGSMVSSGGTDPRSTRGSPTIKGNNGNKKGL